MTERYIPKKVQDARLDDDREALSAMGRAGSRAAQKVRQEKSDRAAFENELAAENRVKSLVDPVARDEAERRRQTNEDIIPAPGPFD